MTTALLAVALLLGERPFVFEITAVDAATKKPIAGAAIDVVHLMSCFKHETREGEPQCKPTDPHPEALLEIRGTTGKDGRFTVRLPDTNYEVNPSLKGNDAYLQPWELQRYLRALPELRRIRPAGERKMEIRLLLVPRSMVEAPEVIRTPERAIEVARERLQRCELPAQVPAPQYIEGEWYVKLGVLTVRVNTLDASADVINCKMACCI
jgi:hypothetical protein